MNAQVEAAEPSTGSEKSKAKKINELMRKKNESQKKVTDLYDQEARILHKLLKESQMKIEQNKLDKPAAKEEQPKKRTKPKIDVRAQNVAPSGEVVPTEGNLIDPDNQA